MISAKFRIANYQGQAVIIARYLTKEILSTFAGVLAILLIIATSVQLVGLFNKVAAGQLNVDIVLVILSLEIINVTVQVLPLAYFIAILLAFSRLYQDSEMTAMTAAGIGSLSVLRSVLMVSLLVAVIQGVLSLQLAPWAEKYIQALSKDAAAKSGIKGMVAGRFQEMDTGIGVIYAESLDTENRQMKNLFIQKREGNKNSLIKAEKGYEVVDKNENLYVVLENGYRYEGEPGQDGYTIIQFEKHGVLAKPGSRDEQTEVEAMKTSQLWKLDSHASQSELQYRISSFLVCISLAMLAVPLSKTSPRQGRYGKLFLAIMFYLTFFNLLHISRVWLQQGSVPVYVGMWWVHGLIIVIAGLFMAKQYGWRNLLRVNRL